MPSTMFWITSKTENRLLIVVSEMVELFRKTSRKFRKIAKEFPGSFSLLIANVIVTVLSRSGNYI